MRRAAAEDTPGGGSSAHAGLGDSEAASGEEQCGELERLLLFLRNSHTGTTAVTAAGGRDGVKVLNRKPDTHLSVWHGVATAPQLIKSEHKAVGDSNNHHAGNHTYVAFTYSSVAFSHLQHLHCDF